MAIVAGVIGSDTLPHNTIMKQIFTTGLMFAAFMYASLAVDLNTARIDELTGLKGKMNEKEGVYKVTFPRDDVKVVVDGWTMPPFMGLGTWAAFTKGAHTEAMPVPSEPCHTRARNSNG
jgi:hypothetical protein